ncbi:conserved hypothetical protein [Ricinus communis]|uniref:Uncharacterized protein n=1 Tax=Ricinus communis TaxID=3988 RepID=B9T044_RICCO|nr:conserved hypothetical protein [Ricinus communis]
MILYRQFSGYGRRSVELKITMLLSFGHRELQEALRGLDIAWNLGVDYICKRNATHNSAKEIVNRIHDLLSTLVRTLCSCVSGGEFVFPLVSYLWLELSFELSNVGQSSCSIAVNFNFRFLGHG